jgi:epoxyqueuosine reductase
MAEDRPLFVVVTASSTPRLPGTYILPMNGLADQVMACLNAGGLPLAGRASPDLPERDRQALALWLSEGRASGMEYMVRTGNLRASLSDWIPWARGLFVAALPYNTSRAFSAHSIRRGGAWISRYAWGRDYHRVMVSRLRPAARLLESRGFRARICVDSAPLLERAYAVKAGLGFVGKNGCLTHPQRGSYLFLGEIVTDLPLVDEGPVPDVCWGCERCMRACPAGAFAAPYVLDARRCLSYWTVEHRGPFPAGAPRLKGHLFGCDRCQEVCPFNLEAPLAEEADFRPREGCMAPGPADVLGRSREGWETLTSGSALRRTGFEGIRRNASRLIEERSRIPVSTGPEQT